MAKVKKTNSKARDYVVYSLIAIVGIGLITFIFWPSEEEDKSNKEMSVPEPAEEQIKDKGQIYEEADYEDLIQVPELDLPSEDDVAATEPTSTGGIFGSQNKNSNPYAEFENAQKSINTMLHETTKVSSTGDYYSSTTEKDNEIARLKNELEQRDKQAILDQAKAQLEESAGINFILKPLDSTDYYIGGKREQEKKSQVAPIQQTGDEKVVSSLNNNIRRNTGFYGMASVSMARKNTIKATVYGKQVVQSGQNVRLRLSEAMQVSDDILPPGSILVGVATVGIDRLMVQISNVEHDGVLTQVDIDVYDADGQRGLFLPGSMEMDALRELGVELSQSMSQSAQTTIQTRYSQSAAEQIKTDLGRGAISGTSNFLNKKLREIKVTIQDEHRVLLMPKM
jgi:conjugative transposon TraM protein